MADQPLIKLLTKIISHHTEKKSLSVDEANTMTKEVFSEYKTFREMVRDKMGTVQVKTIKEKDARKSVFKLLNKVYHFLFPNPKTLDGVLSLDIRKRISTRFGVDSPEHKLSKLWVALDREVKGELLRSAKEKVDKKNLKRTDLDPKELIEVIKNNVNSTDPFRTAVALLGASGSRPVELFLESTYKPVEGYDTYVLQEDVAKKKGRKFNVIKPLIYIKAKEFIERVKFVREAVKPMYKSVTDSVRGGLNGSITDRANRTAKDLIKIDQFTLYKLRAMYVEISYTLYAENKQVDEILGKDIYNPNKNDWTRIVLGHVGDGAVKNYGQFDAKTEKLVSEDLIIRQNQVESKVDELSERLEELNVEPMAPKPVILPNLGIDETKYKAYEPIIKKAYEDNKQPTMTHLESKVLNGKVPRIYIRAFYKKQKQMQ